MGDGDVVDVGYMAGAYFWLVLFGWMMMMTTTITEYVLVHMCLLVQLYATPSVR